MPGSEAVSTASGSPHERTSSSWRRIIDVSSPCLRCVEATLTIVIPAAGTAAPPGTVSRKPYAPAVPTHSAPSQCPSARSGSASAAYSSRDSGERGTPPNANSIQPSQESHSVADNVRKSVFMSPAYQGRATWGDLVSNTLTPGPPAPEAVGWIRSRQWHVAVEQRPSPPGGADRHTGRASRCAGPGWTTSAATGPTG